MSTKLSPIAQRHVIKAEICKIAVDYEDRKVDYDAARDAIQVRIKQWNDVYLSSPRSDVHEELIKLGGHDHLKQRTVPNEQVTLGGISGSGIDMDDLCDAAQTFINHRDTVLITAMDATFRDEIKLFKEAQLPEFPSKLEALIQKRLEIMAEFEALGSTAIDRRLIIDTSFNNDVDLEELVKHAGLDDVVDVNDQEGTISYPSGVASKLFDAIAREDLMIRFVEPIASCIPGHKDLRDYNQRLSTKKRLEATYGPSM